MAYQQSGANDKTTESVPSVRFFTRLVCFGVVFLVSYVAVVFIATNVQAGGVRGLRYTNIPVEAPTYGGQTSYMFRDVDSVANVDILWIGSSHAYRSFDPRFFDARGLSTFNMGTTAQTPLNSYFLLRRYLDSVNPRVVVFEIYWNVLTWDGVESTLDMIANGTPAPWMLSMAIATRDVRAVNAVTRRLTDRRRPALATVQPNLFEGDMYIGGGFVEKDSTFSGDRFWPPGNLVVEPRQLKFVERIVDMVTGKDIPLVLITQPLPVKTFLSIGNRDSLRVSLQTIADRFTVPFIDFNGRIMLDDSLDFFDSHHLSQRGLQRFLPAVHDLLVELRLVSR